MNERKKKKKKKKKKKIKSHEIVRSIRNTDQPTGLVVWQRTVATSHQSRRNGSTRCFCCSFLAYSCGREVPKVLLLFLSYSWPPALFEYEPKPPKIIEKENPYLVDVLSTHTHAQTHSHKKQADSFELRESKTWQENLKRTTS
jgi:hypothetical protein